MNSHLIELEKINLNFEGIKDKLVDGTRLQKDKLVDGTRLQKDKLVPGTKLQKDINSDRL